MPQSHEGCGGSSRRPRGSRGPYPRPGDEPCTYAYGRHGNPGWEALEDALGRLEDAGCVLFAAGLAASLALILSLAKECHRLIMPFDGYYGARNLATKLHPYGIDLVSVDLGDLHAVERALREDRCILWAETPTNPLLRVFDLAQLSALAGRHGAPLVVDNTTATPVLQQPLDDGATACLYTLTKSISGHSDVVLGAVTTRGSKKRSVRWIYTYMIEEYGRHNGHAGCVPERIDGAVGDYRMYALGSPLLGAGHVRKGSWTGECRLPEMR